MKFRSLLENYKQELIKLNIIEKSIPQNEHELVANDDEFLPHILWMINEILQDRRKFSEAKINRWLGFIQCGLMVKKIKSLKELKEESKIL